MIHKLLRVVHMKRHALQLCREPGRTAKQLVRALRRDNLHLFIPRFAFSDFLLAGVVWIAGGGHVLAVWPCFRFRGDDEQGAVDEVEVVDDCPAYIKNSKEKNSVTKTSLCVAYIRRREDKKNEKLTPHMRNER